MLYGKRPIHELLNPNPIDQSAIFESQFNGMTDSLFGYDDYQTTRELLIKIVNESLTPDDKKFLLAFSKGEPDWRKVDYSKFPAIKWKLLNMQKLKDKNSQKHNEQVESLERVLDNR